MNFIVSHLANVIILFARLAVMRVCWFIVQILMLISINLPVPDITFLVEIVR